MEIIHSTAPSIRAMKTNDQMQSGRTIKARTEAGNARKCSNRYSTSPDAINITCDALSYNFIITRLINLPIRSTHRATKAGPNPHSLCISRHCCVRSTSIYTFFVGRKKKECGDESRKIVGNHRIHHTQPFCAVYTTMSRGLSYEKQQARVTSSWWALWGHWSHCTSAKLIFSFFVFNFLSKNVLTAVYDPKSFSTIIHFDYRATAQLWLNGGDK